MAHYKVVQLKEKKGVAEELEQTLNEHSMHGWEFVEMERAHRGTTLFFMLIFRQD